MTEVARYGSTCPQIRPELCFGPPVIGQGKTVHYIKDPQTNWFYQIGEKEYFLFTRMDGKHTLEELAQAYQETYGPSLNAQSWAGLFGLITARHLLVAEDENTLEQRKAEAQQQKQAERNGLFRRHFSLLHPEAFLAKLHSVIRFAFHPAFLYSALILILITEGSFLWQLGSLLETVGTVRLGNPQQNIHLLIPFIVIMWASIAIHETAHGLACKHFGGSVQEMGIAWRYLMFFPYCQVDDIVLFPNRWHRVAVASAGTFTGFLLIMPFALLWRISPPGGYLHNLSALVFVFLNLSNIVNFIPFIEMDGYFMLNHALGFLDLRRQSQTYCKRMIQRQFGAQKPVISAYDQRSGPLYIGYGICSLVFTFLFLLYTGERWLSLLISWLSPTFLWLIVPFLAILLPLRGASALRGMKRQRRAHQRRKLKKSRFYAPHISAQVPDSRQPRNTSNPIDERCLLSSIPLQPEQHNTHLQN